MDDRQQSSQQERRVYVGNLAYDVKWHHLKDYMREGISHITHITTERTLTISQLVTSSSPTSWSFRTE